MHQKDLPLIVDKILKKNSKKIDVEKVARMTSYLVKPSYKSRPEELGSQFINMKAKREVSTSL